MIFSVGCFDAYQLQQIIKYLYLNFKDKTQIIEVYQITLMKNMHVNENLDFYPHIHFYNKKSE